MKRCLLSLLMVVALPVWAESGERQPLPAVPPPPPGMEAFDAALEPQVTIVRKDKETRHEYRVNGRLYMIRVVPAVGPEYFLIDQDGQGNFVKTNAVNPVVQPPMWVIRTW